MKTVADDCINIYNQYKQDAIKEITDSIKEDQLSEDKLNEKVEEIYPHPYVYFVNPEFYEKFIKTWDETIWKNMETNLLAESALYKYLSELKEKYVVAYRFQQTQNKEFLDYINKNGLTKEELEKFNKK